MCLQLNELEHVPEKNEKEIGELSVREEKLCKDLEKVKPGAGSQSALLKKHQGGHQVRVTVRVIVL